MEVEILLDVDEVKPEDLPQVEQRFRKWYDEGSEARYGRHRFEYLQELDKPFRYQVDFGQADPTRALQHLHGKLFPYGVKVFVHFLH
ncbi:hypothetical protein [Desulfurivibrio alkaliphilus]|uniref:Uncharacterized protein n=1 Tax=Desulfurivibrio alkaliphilus (strain DSM 19089 / UNIQEM U267 / AHT2) TaxID=589865 RepID=D6Z4X1_DESAT|nr:hypothetical protein [Desulfurivibrio alkaliphilus]ADH86596.1 hypothetical protein DaAHT2_1916 [Desulfurivibrio alkaliphilus AHT 2]